MSRSIDNDQKCSEWKELVDDSISRWDNNASFWDSYIGEGNAFQKELINPDTLKLLDLKQGQKVLDIACGNGNFSRKMAEMGASVVAFDGSPVMIECAKAKSDGYSADRIDYRVIDATDYNSLTTLGAASFDAAVSNMALMDIAEISPLLKAVYVLLKPGGIFVFSVMHPCFQAPGAKKVVEEEEVGGAIVCNRSVRICRYIAPETFEGLSVNGQPVPTRYFHRPLSVLLNQCFEAGFSMDGVAEPVFRGDGGNSFRFEWIDIPPALVLKFRK